MSSSKKRRFSEEFKRDAVSLIHQEGYTLKAASERLGIHESVLGKWKRRLTASSDTTEQPPLADDSSAVQAELRRLRAENRRLQLERDILKKATAFFAKDSL